MRKSSSITNLVWMLAPLVLAIPIGYVVFLLKYYPSDLLPVIALACIIGFGMLVLSKVPTMRKGRFMTWGTREMRPRDRLCYRIGYFLMSFGVVLLIAILMQ